MRSTEVLVLAGETGRLFGGLGDQADLLTGYERERAAAFVSATDATDYVAAHLLVRVVAAQCLGTTPDRLTLAQSCDRCGGPHGRPSIVESPDLAVSLSHTRGYVAAAAGPGPLGVDVEGSPYRGGPFPDGVLAPAERERLAAAEDPAAAFVALWVRKEALVKAGRASLDTLGSIDLAGADDQWGGLRLTGWQESAGFAGACAAPAGAAVRVMRPGA